MADIKISELDAAAALDGTELFEGVQGGVSVKVTGAQQANLAKAIKVTSTITSNTITPAGDTDLLRAFGLSAGLTIANPSATPIDGWGFVAYIEDNGTTRSLTWGSKYDDSEFAALPTATTAGKRHRLGFEYHAGDDKLYCMYAEVEP